MARIPRNAGQVISVDSSRRSFAGTSAALGEVAGPFCRDGDLECDILGVLDPWA